jgi:hypothetical protein
MSGKPYGLDQPRSLRHMARITETPAPQGLPYAQGGLMEIEHLIRYTELAVGLKPSAI